VPSGLQGAFEGATDTSQTVDRAVRGSTADGSGHRWSPITVTANRVRLRMTQFTGNVERRARSTELQCGQPASSVRRAGIIGIQVETSSNTIFRGNGCHRPSRRQYRFPKGLLFKNGGNPPVLIAKKVRKR